MMTVQCPSCQKVYNIPESMAGKQVRCKACQTEFVIGSMDSAPAAAPAGQQSVAAPRPAAPMGSLQTGSRTPRAGRPTSSSKSTLLIGGAAVGVLALAALAYFVVVPMFFGGQGDWIAPLVPENADLIVHFDAESLMNSTLWKTKIEGELKKEGSSPEAGLKDMLATSGMDSKIKLTVAEIDAVFVGISGLSQAMQAIQKEDIQGAMKLPVVVGLRLKEDKSLSALLPGGQDEKTHADMKYVTLPLGPQPGLAVYVGQVDGKTFCATIDEALLKSTLERVASGGKAKLSDGVQAALDAVDGQDHFIVLDMGKVLGMAADMLKKEAGPMGGAISEELATAGISGVGLGFSANGDLELSVCAVLTSDAKAKELAEKLDENLVKAKESLDKKMAEKLPEEILKQMKQQRDVLDDVSISQSGAVVTVTASIATDVAIDMMK